jgi:hypothetical protein
MENIKFGHKVKDKVTGFEGICTAEIKYMNGCEKWQIDGKVVNNQIECIWVDKQQVIKLDDGIVKEVEQEIKGGGSITQPINLRR